MEIAGSPEALDRLCPHHGTEPLGLPVLSELMLPHAHFCVVRRPDGLTMVPRDTPATEHSFAEPPRWLDARPYPACPRGRPHRQA